MTVRRINLDNPLNLFESVFGSGAYNQLPNYWMEQAKSAGNFPPYNLTKNEESTKFTLTLAVAGFAPADLDVSVRDNQLVISGEIKQKEDTSGLKFVNRGIAERTFTKVFDLGEYVEVKNVTYKNGLLIVNLALELPEAKKPKKFSITSE